MYLCDNGMQLTTAMEDFEYTKWLDPERVPCYVRDSVSRIKEPWSGLPPQGFLFTVKNKWRAWKGWVA